MPIDKVLSTSIAEGAVTASAISNTANLIVSSVAIGANVTVNTSAIFIGNSTVNSIIHSTGITANGSNIHGINATNIATGTLDTARLPATANVSTAVNVGANVNLNTSGVSIGNSTVNTLITTQTISLNGVNVNTAISSNAATAYSNAISIAANASNISSGTLNIARISDGAVTAAKLSSSAITDKLGYTPAVRYYFNPVLRHSAWSRLFRMSVGPLYAAALVTISHTRDSVVHGSTHFVSGGHSGGATIAQLGSHYYSQVQVGVEGDGNNDWWFVVNDNAYKAGYYGTPADFTWDCFVIPLMGSVSNLYTSYTAGSGSNRASYTTANGGTGTNATSDARLKSHLQTITNAVDKIKQLNGYTFLKDGDSERDVGLIAQEVLNVLPEAVTGLPPSNIDSDIRQQIMDSNSYVLGLKYGNMSALFVEAIKEQQQQIDQLKEQIEILKSNK